jgi:hypothetical protein
VLQVFKECHLSDGSGNFFELSLVGCKCIGAYVWNKRNQNRIIKFVASDLILLFKLANWLDAMFLKCRLAGYGKKSVRRMIEGSSGS